MARTTITRLTPELQRQLVAAIRSGAYPHIAAAALGMPRELLDDWLGRGRTNKARELYRSFLRGIEQAHAQARLRAEIEMLEHEPRIWLEHGPGRDRADAPGWSAAVKPAEVSTTSPNALLQPEVRALVQVVREELTQLPEQRRRISERLDLQGFSEAA